jgi:intracellular septation protein
MIRVYTLVCMQEAGTDQSSRPAPADERMNQLIDFLPVALFVVVYFVADVYWATGALMVAVALQVTIFLLLKKPLSRELKVTFWASMIFGGLTLTFHNQLFIQWKPTIVNWLLAASLIGSHFIGRHNLIRRMFEGQLTLVDEVWTRLNFGWACGFFFAGVLNLIVAYNFSMEFWVGYKLIGGLALTFLYIAITILYLHRKGFLSEPLADAGPGNEGRG